MKIIINIDNKKRASAKSWTINKTKVAQIDEKSAVILLQLSDRNWRHGRKNRDFRVRPRKNTLY